MNRTQRRTMMANAADIASPGTFKRGGGSLSDFMENFAANEDDSAAIGAKIFDYFCLDEDSAFNNFMPGVQLALAFLGDMLKWPEPEQRVTCMRDLKSILTSGDAHRQIPAWIRGNFR